MMPKGAGGAIKLMDGTPASDAMAKRLAELLAEEGVDGKEHGQIQ